MKTDNKITGPRAEIADHLTAAIEHINKVESILWQCLGNGQRIKYAAEELEIDDVSGDLWSARFALQKARSGVERPGE